MTDADRLRILCAENNALRKRNERLNAENTRLADEFQRARSANTTAQTMAAHWKLKATGEPLEDVHDAEECEKNAAHAMGVVRENRRLRDALHRIASAKDDAGTYEGNFAWMWEVAAEALAAATGEQMKEPAWNGNEVDNAAPAGALLAEVQREAKDLARDALAAEMKESARLRAEVGALKAEMRSDPGGLPNLLRINREAASRCEAENSMLRKAINTAGHALDLGASGQAREVLAAAVRGEDSPDAFASRLGPWKPQANKPTTCVCGRDLTGWDNAPACAACDRVPSHCRCMKMDE